MRQDFAADPENALHWRMSKRRLEAECIRDAVLSASGQLQAAARRSARSSRWPATARSAARAASACRRRRSSMPARSSTCARSICRSRAICCPTRSPSSIFRSRAWSAGIRETHQCARRRRSSSSTRPSSRRRRRRLAARVLATYPAGPNGGAAGQSRPARHAGLLARLLARRRRPRRSAKPRAIFSRGFPASWKTGDDQRQRRCTTPPRRPPPGPASAARSSPCGVRELTLR